MPDTLAAVLRDLVHASHARGAAVLHERDGVVAEAGTLPPVRLLGERVADALSGSVGLSRLIGEHDFSLLLEDGDAELHVSPLAADHTLVIAFDGTTSLGLVRHVLRPFAARLQALLTDARHSAASDR